MAAGLVIGIVGVSAAQTDSPTTTVAPDAGTDEAPAPGREGFKGRGGPGGPGGPRGHGLMGAIHGEFVVPNGTDAYRTMAVQRGEVTAVSPTAITVKSADEFSRTYAVDDNTLVNAGRDGIADVAVGNEVHVSAVVNGDTANAMDIRDITTTQAIREHWAPPGD